MKYVYVVRNLDLGEEYVEVFTTLSGAAVAIQKWYEEMKDVFDITAEKIIEEAEERISTNYTFAYIEEYGFSIQKVPLL